MKATYDVSVVPRNYAHSKYVHDLYNFMDSEHQNAKYEYDTERQAFRAYQSFHNAKSRYSIYGVKITRKGNVVYLSKDKDGKSVGKITNYDRIHNMSVEELAKCILKFPCMACEYYEKEIHSCCSPPNYVCTREHTEKQLLDWLKSEEWDAD